MPDELITAEDWKNKGNEYSEAGEYEKAIEYYNKAIEIDPEYARAYGARGSAYKELKIIQKLLSILIKF